MTEADETLIFEARPAVLPGVGAWLLTIVTLGLAFPFYWIRSVSTRYRATTRRIQLETGLLGKRTDNTELYRVRDIAITRPFGQRLLGTANIVMMTNDTTHPELTLFGLRGDVDGWMAKLRDAAEAERVRRGRIVMEQ